MLSLNECFQQLCYFRDTFGFLFNIASISNTDNALLHSNCHNIQRILTPGTDSSNNGDSSSDVDSTALYDELTVLSDVLPDSVFSPLQVLRYLRRTNLDTSFPNISIALRILLPIPITVASGECSFSKLKLIKTYLLSSMSQERLVGLAMLSIENDIAADLDYTQVINKFAAIKARKICL